MPAKHPSDSLHAEPQGAGEILDLIIIGGGISGAASAYDAALRGLRLALFEKSDYASGTSQATSRLIHGGLRYLKNFEFPLVLESLRERRILARLAPHALSPMPFLLPIRKDRGPGFALMGLGLRLYDFLSFLGKKNRGLKTGLRLPAARRLSAEEMIGLEALSQSRHLRGGFLYYDYANHSPERLTCEFLFAARAQGAKIQNYAEVTSIRYEEGVYQIEIFDRKGGRRQSYRSRSLLNTSGPWADRVLGLALADAGKRAHLTRSMGIHLVTRRIAGDKTLVLMRPDGSHMFLIPLANRSLIGTTDQPWHGDPDDFQVTEDDIFKFICDVNEACPAAALSIQDVEYFYGGLRPLVEESPNVSSYQASRKTEIEDHTQDGLPGFYSALGGKFTTSRALAEKAMDQICCFLQIEAPCRTAESVLPAGDFGDFWEFADALGKSFPEEDGRKLLCLARRYGALAGPILEEFRKQGLSSAKAWRAFQAGKKGKARFLGRTEKARWQARGGIFGDGGTVFVAANGEPWYIEEISHILRYEDVEHIDDLLFRRTSLGLFGRPPLESQKALLEFAASELGWDSARKRKEKRRLDLYYTPGARRPK